MMKKHMLKETNSMRRLMGLHLLNEEFKEKEIGVYDNEEQLRDYEEGEDSSMSMPTMDEQDEDIFEGSDDIFEDSEGEETYNYGEDEGADEHKEDEMEDELHHDEEDMAPHDRIKAIEDHLDALKKDMGYDEDHEDRDEEGTHFAEGKRYSKVLNTLTESQYRKLKRFIK
jgi:hypothetical protein